MKKRLLAIALTLALLLGFGGIAASAATPEEEARALLEQTQAIFNSRTYILKGRGTSPVGPGGSGTAHLVMAMDKDKLMVETEVDWPAMMAAVGGSHLAGFILQMVLGKSFRMVFSPEGVFWVFPDRRLYLDLAPMMEAEGAEGAASLIEGLDMLGISGAIPEDLDVTQPVIGGKTYLCVTFDGYEGSSMSYYFLDGQLKRIEVFNETSDENMVIEIDQLSGTVDASYFSTRWLVPIPLRLFISTLPIF